MRASRWDSSASDSGPPGGSSRGDSAMLPPTCLSARGPGPARQPPGSLPAWCGPGAARPPAATAAAHGLEAGALRTRHAASRSRRACAVGPRRRRVAPFAQRWARYAARQQQRSPAEEPSSCGAERLPCATWSRARFSLSSGLEVLARSRIGSAVCPLFTVNTL